MTYSEEDEYIRRKFDIDPQEAEYSEDTGERDGSDVAAFRAQRLSLIDQMLACREKYTPREWGTIQLYYRNGLPQTEIAWILGCSQQMVSHALQTARRKALS